jgi:hypothetical protein
MIAIALILPRNLQRAPKPLRFTRTLADKVAVTVNHINPLLNTAAVLQPIEEAPARFMLTQRLRREDVNWDL